MYLYINGYSQPQKSAYTLQIVVSEDMQRSEIFYEDSNIISQSFILKYQ